MQVFLQETAKAIATRYAKYDHTISVLTHPQINKARTSQAQPQQRCHTPLAESRRDPGTSTKWAERKTMEDGQ
jgi:hypothetical protein